MIPLNVDINIGLRDCCVCGNHTAPEASLELQLATGDITADGITYREIGGPVCSVCEHEWKTLEHKVGRDVSGDEFLLFVLSEAARGTRKGQRFLKRVSNMTTVNMYGHVFADIAEAILRGAGHQLRVVCPNCGDKCHIEQNGKET